MGQRAKRKLIFFSCRPTVSEEDIKEAFEKAGFQVKGFKFFPTDRKMALLQLESVDDAVIALIVSFAGGHLTNVGCFKKLFFFRRPDGRRDFRRSGDRRARAFPFLPPPAPRSPPRLTHEIHVENVCIISKQVRSLPILRGR